MKKIYKLLLISFMLVAALFIFTSCGKSNEDADDTEDVSVEETSEEATEATTEEATTEAQVDEDGYTVVYQTVKTTAGVNVRTEPSTDSSIYTQLASGTEVTRTAIGDEWSKVSIDGSTFYIHNDYIEYVADIETSTTTDDEDATSGETVTTTAESNGKIVCIDAGHQTYANTDTEPVGPGATEEKAKVSAGNVGVTTGTQEYALNLSIALKLQELLVARGYTVIMIRTTNDVDISNAERAEIANSEGADAFIRIHANGSTNTDASGVLTVCNTASNPYNASIYTECKALATAVLNGLVAATGASSEGVWETDSMSGINWSSVPVTIVEVGYLTNSAEDQLLATDSYQTQIATGIANGIDTYFSTN